MEGCMNATKLLVNFWNSCTSRVYCLTKCHFKRTGLPRFNA